MKFTLAAYTDAGIRKATNQDSVCLRRAQVAPTNEVLMAVVCDGMGGLEKGEVASGTCVSAFAAWFDQQLPRFPEMCANGLEPIRDQWDELLHFIHQKLQDHSTAIRLPLGTTVAALFAYGNQFLVTNVGDTRVYSSRNQMQRLTQDHSLVAREVQLGHISEAEARSHPQRNLLLQCIGQGEALAPSYVMGRLQSNMLFFLCTDGYTHTFSDDEMGQRLSPLFLDAKDSMVTAMMNLAERCKSAGETDNITGVLVKVRENTIATPKNGIAGLLDRLRPVSANLQSQSPILLETSEILHSCELL